MEFWLLHLEIKPCGFLQGSICPPPKLRKKQLNEKKKKQVKRKKTYMACKTCLQGANPVFVCLRAWGKLSRFLFGVLGRDGISNKGQVPRKLSLYFLVSFLSIYLFFSFVFFFKFCFLYFVFIHFFVFIYFSHVFLIVFFIDFLFYVCLVFVSVIFWRLDFGV